MTLDPAISLTLAATLALLFGAACVHKLADPARFRAAVANYRVLPGALATPAAVSIVVLEAAATVLLLVPSTRGSGALLAAALLVAYGVAMAVNLARGRTALDCGCFGAGRRRQVKWGMVVRNAGLAVAALVAGAPVAPRALEPLDVMTVAGATVALALLYAAQGALAAVPRLPTSGRHR